MDVKETNKSITVTSNDTLDDKIVSSNQSPASTSTKEADSEINIQTYSESLPPSLITNEDNGRAVLVKAQQAGESVLDLADAVGAKLYSIAKEKFGKLDKALNPNYVSAVRDSRKIQTLGPMVEELARVFEDTMTMIGSVSYKEQADFLTGYKKLIKEQINVIDSRIGMTKRLGYR